MTVTHIIIAATLALIIAATLACAVVLVLSRRLESLRRANDQLTARIDELVPHNETLTAQLAARQEPLAGLPDLFAAISQGDGIHNVGELSQNEHRVRARVRALRARAAAHALTAGQLALAEVPPQFRIVKYSPVEVLNP